MKPSLPHDIRHACRSILRMPAVSLVVVFSLAAAIGVNTVVFSWIQARILEPVPGIADGAEVRLIEPRSEAGLYLGTSWPEYLDMRERLRTFSSVFAARMTPLYVGEPGAVERVFGLLVSANYFSALGLQPAAGRFFRPDEVQHPGREPVAVISHRLWQALFLGAPGILGRAARINGEALTVIGVTPPEFQGTTVGLQFDIWLPATLAPAVANGSRELEERSVRGYGVMGRLRDGATHAQAQRELQTLMRDLARTYPVTNGDTTAEVLAFHQSPRGPQRMLNAALAALQGIMLLLLLAVCGNLATLMLARASARQKEIGIRLALGARPWRIATLLLSENLLLALIGGALGAVLAVWGTQALVILPMTGLPLRFQTSIDATGAGFAMGLGALSGLLFGGAAAVHLARLDPHLVFRAGTRSAGRSVLRQGLIGVQVALAVIVLIVAGLVFRAFLETRTADPGFRRDDVTLAAYDLAGRAADEALQRDLAHRALQRLRALPFVEAAAIAASVPLDIHGLPSRGFTIDGHARSDGRPDVALMNTVTPDYFEVMGIPILAGTDFATLGDTAAPPQAIVNETFIRRYVTTTGEPLGRRIYVRGVPYTIVGTVRDSLSNAFGEPPTPVIYLSYRDNPQPRGEIHVRFRPGAPPTAAADIARAMQQVDPDLPVFNVRSLTQHVDTNLIFRRIPAQMFSVLGPMLLALAAIGIYAVVSYAVSLRTREIGLRLALGATGRRVVRAFVWQSLRVAGAGGIIGLSLAIVAARLYAPGGRLDPWVFLIVPAGLGLVAALACWIPARRAAAIDPAIALRAE